MNVYIALGLGVDGGHLVLQPKITDSAGVITPTCILLASLEKVGREDGCAQVGEMLIRALGAFDQVVDTFGLTRGDNQRILDVWFDSRAVMRPGWVGLGFTGEVLQPALVINAFDGGFQVTRGFPFYVRVLAERGPVEASLMVGETMVRNLTAINPSIRHQFPALFT
jgi:hypothetical protein